MMAISTRPQVRHQLGSRIIHLIGRVMAENKMQPTDADAVEFLEKVEDDTGKAYIYIKRLEDIDRQGAGKLDRKRGQLS